MDQQWSTNHILLTARLEERNSENSKISHNSKADGLEEGIRGNYKKNRKTESLEGTVADSRGWQADFKTKVSEGGATVQLSQWACKKPSLVHIVTSRQPVPTNSL